MQHGCIGGRGAVPPAQLPERKLALVNHGGHLREKEHPKQQQPCGDEGAACMRGLGASRQHKPAHKRCRQRPANSGSATPARPRRWPAGSNAVLPALLTQYLGAPMLLNHSHAASACGTASGGCCCMLPAAALTVVCSPRAASGGRVLQSAAHPLRTSDLWTLHPVPPTLLSMQQDWPCVQQRTCSR